MNKNSMCYWWPLVQEKTVGIPIPKTYIVSLDDVESIKNAAQRLRYPVFLRTDLCSGKHDWSQSCFVQDETKVEGNLQRVIDSNVRWKMLGIEPRAAVIREFLTLESTFTAFSGNMPINKERRYFVQNGKVVCRHPYWPISVFNNHPARMANDPEWEAKLFELNKTDDSEFVLDDYASQVSEAFGDEAWSVDFAKGLNGQWYLLDMALAYNSFHWPDCEVK